MTSDDGDPSLPTGNETMSNMTKPSPNGTETNPTVTSTVGKTIPTLTTISSTTESITNVTRNMSQTISTTTVGVTEMTTYMSSNMSPFTTSANSSFSHNPDIISKSLQDFWEECSEFINQTNNLENFHPPTKDLLQLFSTFNVIALEIGLFVNFIGIATCKADMSKTEFGNYLNICLIISMPLMVWSYVVSCSHLTDVSTGVFTNFVPTKMCHFVQTIYMFMDNVHACSMLLLCFNRIRNQRGIEMEQDHIDALRWPFMGNCALAMVMCVLTARYAHTRLYFVEDKHCLVRVDEPFCDTNEHDIIFSSIPIILDSIAVALVLLLLVEIFLKKRRWKKHIKYWDKKRNSAVVSVDDLEMSDVRALVRGVMTRRKSTVSSASYGSQGIPLARRKMAVLTAQSRSLTSANKDYDKETIDEFNAFYEQEMLPENSTSESRTILTLTLMTSIILFRVPRDLLFSVWLRDFLESHLAVDVQLRTVLAMSLLHQFGLILPVPLFCLLSSAYMQASLDWLFQRHLNHARVEFSPRLAKSIMSKFRRHPTTVFVEEQWADKASLTNKQLRINRAAQTLTHYMAVSNHNLDIMDMLARSSMDYEPAFLEEFLNEIGADTTTMMESKLSNPSSGDSCDEDSYSDDDDFNIRQKAKKPAGQYFDTSSIYNIPLVQSASTSDVNTPISGPTSIPTSPRLSEYPINSRSRSVSERGRRESIGRTQQP